MHRARIIALIGIDGAGKSTALNELKQDTEFADVRFVFKKHREAVNSVLDAFDDIEQSPMEYLTGDFGNAIRWAHAFDFLQFFDEEVRPLLEQPICIVSDRWSVCSEAFAAVGPNLRNDVAGVLSCVPPADRLIHLMVSPEEAMRRIRSNHPPQGDESLALLEAFEQGYERCLATSLAPIVRVKTNDRREVLTLIKKNISEAVRSIRTAGMS